MEKSWQIFNQDNIEILEKCSFISYSYTTNTAIAQIPLEQGSFAQYNKINAASVLEISLAHAGSDSECIEILRTLDEEKEKASKLTILSPEKIFNSFSLQGYSYKKEASSGIMIIDLKCVEIKEIDMNHTSSSLSMLNLLNPCDASTFIRGQVQAIASHSGIISKISSYF